MFLKFGVDFCRQNSLIIEKNRREKDIRVVRSFDFFRHRYPFKIAHKRFETLHHILVGNIFWRVGILPIRFLDDSVCPIRIVYFSRGISGTLCQFLLQILIVQFCKSSIKQVILHGKPVWLIDQLDHIKLMVTQIFSAEETSTLSG